MFPLLTFLPAFLLPLYPSTYFSPSPVFIDYTPSPYQSPPKHIHTLLRPPKLLLNTLQNTCSSSWSPPKRHFNPLISSAVFFRHSPTPIIPRKACPFIAVFPPSPSSFASHPFSPVAQLCQRKSSMKNVLTLHNCRFPHVSHLLESRATCMLNWCQKERLRHTCAQTLCPHPATLADVLCILFCAN